MLLEAGTTCWRREIADQGALIIDAADYFDAAMRVMQRARHTVHLLNWAFEPQTLLHPGEGCTGPDSDRIGEFLKRLAEDKPHLDVRILCWKSALPVAATQDWFTIADRKAFAGTRVKLVLDGKLPLGASHHQKAIIVDDAVAFCGGADIGPERWDTDKHWTTIRAGRKPSMLTATARATSTAATRSWGWSPARRRARSGTCSGPVGFAPPARI